MGTSQDSGKIVRHFLITGRVQGVGFRRFVQSVAVRLGAAGAVRNLEDGRVEALASAEPEIMRSFEKELATGPAGSKVTDIVAVDVEPGDHSIRAQMSGNFSGDFSGNFSGNFSVQPDGRKAWL
jgi:acylphosphatase